MLETVEKSALGHERKGNRKPSFQNI